MYRPLAAYVCLQKNISDKWSPRQQRHLCFISEFTTDVRYVTGADNVVADALSRAPVDESPHIANMESVFTGVIDYVDMQTCQVSRNFRESPEMGRDLQVSRNCKENSRN